MQLFHRRRFLGLCMGSALLHACRVQAQSSFTVYDSLIYRQKPNIGLPKAMVLTSGFWAKGNRKTPDETACRKQAQYAASHVNRFVIDIEHWPIDIRIAPKTEVQTTIENINQIYSWMKSERPNLLIGVYLFPPIRDYWTPARGNSEAKANWRAANEFLSPIARKVDFLSPSLYTFYDNPTGWQRYALANIAEAERFGKPLYPFIWPRFHPSNKKLSGTYVSGSFWKLQLQTVRSSSSKGVILWDSAQRTPTSYLDPTWDWWKETVKFVETLK